MKYQKDDLAKFPEQISYALANYKPHGLKAGNFNNIILSGLGGSGIAGRIAKSLLFNSSSLPIEVISDYVLPEYASSKTLAIMSSYSGNTEETLAMYEAASKKGCTIVAVTTGGKLAELAEKAGHTIYRAVPGFQPRMALGYSLTYLLQFFGELFNNEVKSSLHSVAEKLKNTDYYIAQANEFVEKFKSGYPKKIVVVTDYITNPVGLRFCQQIQENTKDEAFLHELPESNHNVIESYYGQMNSVFFFLNSHSNERTELRFSFLKELLENNNNTLIELNVNSAIGSIYENIYVLDWISLILADLKGVNSSLITNINGLKNFLSSK